MTYNNIWQRTSMDMKMPDSTICFYDVLENDWINNMIVPRHSLNHCSTKRSSTQAMWVGHKRNLTLFSSSLVIVGRTNRNEIFCCQNNLGSFVLKLASKKSQPELCFSGLWSKTWMRVIKPNICSALPQPSSIHPIIFFFRAINGQRPTNNHAVEN